MQLIPLVRTRWGFKLANHPATTPSTAHSTVIECIAKIQCGFCFRCAPVINSAFANNVTARLHSRLLRRLKQRIAAPVIAEPPG